MTVKYKVIERGQPGVTGGGTKKFYASANSIGKIELQEISEEIAGKSSLTGGDVLNTLEQFIEILPAKLLNGFSVKLGDFGTFRITISSEGKATADEISASAIKGAKVQFRPGVRILDDLAKVKYEKID